MKTETIVSVEKDLKELCKTVTEKEFLDLLNEDEGKERCFSLKEKLFLVLNKELEIDEVKSYAPILVNYGIYLVPDILYLLNRDKRSFDVFELDRALGKYLKNHLFILQTFYKENSK